MSNFSILISWVFSPHAILRPFSLVRYLLLALLLCLSACTQYPGHQTRQASTATATEKPKSPYTMPAEAYLALARNQGDAERENMLLLAAGRFIDDAEFSQAEDVLAQIKSSSAVQADEKAILLARINSAKGQYQAAMNRLSSVHQTQALPQYYQIEYYQLLASAYEVLNQLAFAVQERMKLERLYADEKLQMINSRKLWLDLMRIPMAELNIMALEAHKGSELSGWLRLALIARQPESGQVVLSSSELLGSLERWQQRYPNHPAQRLLPSSVSAMRSILHDSPHQLALLLPLTGPLAGPGTAIRDGVVAAHEAQAGGAEVDIKAYDTNGRDITQLYQEVIAKGADYVIGPLDKPSVSQVANLDHPVPTLLLNDSEVAGRENTYRFGLSYPSEARQVAYRAREKGLHHALIIAPTGAWGDEIVTAFSQQWRAGGGTVVDRFTYDAQTDLNTGIRDFLKVSAREASRPQYHGKGKNSSAKRRQDFDMIFLLAYPSKARQIMPLLRYYFAGNVPVYATSTVYSGTTNTIQDKDLDGLIFCDMLWVFSRQLPNKNWPESLNSYNRLYAMGVDSYAVAMQLNRFILFPAMTSTQVGVLYLNAAHQIGRILAWGQFRSGIAQLSSET